jgi:predicted alpha/beta-fold hydrolase
MKESDVTAPVMDQIKKPFFFFSTMDDPFFGEKVIPFEN